MTSDDAVRVLDLLGRAFPRGALWFRLGPPAEALQWRVRDAPWGTTAVLMELESRLIGYTLHIHRRILIDGTERIARDGVDLCIDPEFQGRGLFRSLHRFEDQHVDCHFDFVLNYATHPASVHVGADRGSRALGNPVRDFERPVDLRRLTGRPLYLRGGGLRRWFRMALAAAVRGVRHPTPRPRWAITTVPRFDERIEAFCTQASAPFALIHKRTCASLNWRYCDPRGGLFTVRLAQAQGHILGYSVLMLRDTVGHIADLLALPDRLDVVRSLVVDALQLLKTSSAISVRCRMVNVHPYTAVLRRYGFEAIHADAGTVYRPRRLGSEALAFLQAANAPIHLTMGDSDHI